MQFQRQKNIDMVVDLFSLTLVTCF